MPRAVMLSAYFFNDDGTCTHYKNGRRSLITSVRGPVDVLSHVRTRARSLHFGHYSLWWVAYPAAPSFRCRFVATPRHPACSRLTVCNWLVYFKCTNFGGRSRNRLFIVVFTICHCEKRLFWSRRGNPPKGYRLTAIICCND